MNIFGDLFAQEFYMKTRDISSLFLEEDFAKCPYHSFLEKKLHDENSEIRKLLMKKNSYSNNFFYETFFENSYS